MEDYVIPRSVHSVHSIAGSPISDYPLVRVRRLGTKVMKCPLVNSILTIPFCFKYLSNRFAASGLAVHRDTEKNNAKVDDLLHYKSGGSTPEAQNGSKFE